MMGDPEAVREASVKLAQAMGGMTDAMKEGLGSDPEKLEAARKAFMENNVRCDLAFPSTCRLWAFAPFEWKIARNMANSKAGTAICGSGAVG
jgi:hypothetical protein